MHLRDILRSGQVLILDGAMGTALEPRGLQEKCDANVTDPEEILQIHRRYIRAGCQAVTANTLSGNGISLARHGLAARAADINAAGVRLAREAAGTDHVVLGDMGR